MIFLYIFLSLFISILLTLVLYYKNRLQPFNFTQIIVLSVIRTIALFIVIILLFPIPINKKDKFDEKPLIVILVDNSQSMIFSGDSIFVKTQLANQIKVIQNQLQQIANVKIYAFDSSVYTNFNYEFHGQQTNLSSALDLINQKYNNKNLVAILIITDGIINAGPDPLIISERINVPIFTVGIGDSIQFPDLSVQSVRYNKQVALGNFFPIEIVIKAKNLKNRNSLLIIKNQQKEIFRKNIHVNTNNYSEVINTQITAENPGLHTYTISLVPIDNEKNIQNNSTLAIFNVIDKKIKGAIIFETPHPDIQALSSAFDETQLFYLRSIPINQITKEILTENDFFILYQSPISNLYFSKINEILQYQKPVFWILGSKTNLSLLKTIMPDIRIQILKQNALQEYMPSYNQSFTGFSLSIAAQSLIEHFPPLIFPLSTINHNETFKTLLFQKIGNVKTNQPLLIFQTAQKPEKAILFGEGYYKWRLYEFQQNQNHTISNEIIHKTIFALTQKSNNNKLRVYHKDYYLSNENVEITAEFYNMLNQISTDPDIHFKIKFNNSTKTYLFTKLTNNYHLDFGKLNPGRYDWIAYTNFEKTYYETSGSFYVDKFNLEFFDLKARYDFLNELAHKTNGKFFNKLQMNEIANHFKISLELKTISYYFYKIDSLISKYQILFLFIFLLVTEWFLRKFYGYI